MSKAGMVLDEKIVGIWFIGWEKRDWMAGVRELEPEAKYELTYRFRYHKDDGIFESEDKKSWYSGTLSGTRAFVVASIKSMARGFATASDGKLYEVLNDDRDLDKFMRVFQEMPFVYMRQVGPEEETYDRSDD
jgi:hypothetical protein